MNTATAIASREETTWSARFKAYDLGVPLPERHIQALAQIIRDIDTADRDFRSQLILKTDHELVWNKGLEWNLASEKTRQILSRLEYLSTRKLLGFADEAVFRNFDHVAFAGFQLIDISTERDLRLVVRPVYRVHAHTGAWFDFSSSRKPIMAYDGILHPAFEIISRGQA